MKRHAVAGWVGAGLVLVGAFMPWATARAGLFSVSISGVDNNGDGVFTAGAAAVVMLVLLVAKPSSLTTAVLAIAGLGCGGVGVYDWNRLNEMGNADATVSVGPGLIMTILGGAAMFAGGLMRDADETPPQPLPPPTL